VFCRSPFRTESSLGWADDGNMKRLIDLKLVCSKCKARVFDMYLFAHAGDVEAFMRGDDVERSEDF
jgi:hypothetical protein